MFLPFVYLALCLTMLFVTTQSISVKVIRSQPELPRAERRNNWEHHGPVIPPSGCPACPVCPVVPADPTCPAVIACPPVSTCPTPIVVPDVPGTEISTIAETESDEDDKIILDYIVGLAELQDPPVINLKMTVMNQSIPSRLFTTKDAVIVLEDDYCIEDPGDWAQQGYNSRYGPAHSLNCTAYTAGWTIPAGNGDSNLDAPPPALKQIYRWKWGSVITLGVRRVNSNITVDLNRFKSGAQPKLKSVRTSQFTRTAIPKAARLWNHAEIGVRFNITTDLSQASFVVSTGGIKASSPTALASANAPYKEPGFQYQIFVWDNLLDPERHVTSVTVLVHELGHALGLAHNNNEDPLEVYEVSDADGFSLMATTVSPEKKALGKIPDRDITGAYSLYNYFTAPKTDDVVITLLQAPRGPVYKPSRPAEPQCKFGTAGFCVYY